MRDIETVIEPVVTIATTVEVPAELPELVYTYQPTDEQGRTLGGKQVVKYRTSEELAQKLTEQNVQLVRALREQTKKQRLGVHELDALPDEAPRFDTPLEFKPRPLTGEERVQLSRDILDPEKFESATNTLFEASLGAKPEVIGQALTRLSQAELNLLAKVESDAFMQSTPEYYACMDNFTAITDWMIKNNLKPVRQNFQRAYTTLKEQGIILGKPEPVVTPNVPAEIVDPIEEPVPVEPVVMTPKVVPPSTGLRQKDNVGPTPPKPKYTLRDINNMPSEEYKKKILFEKGFPELVQKLEQEHATKGRNR